MRSNRILALLLAVLLFAGTAPAAAAQTPAGQEEAVYAASDTLDKIMEIEESIFFTLLPAVHNGTAPLDTEDLAAGDVFDLIVEVRAFSNGQQMTKEQVDALFGSADWSVIMRLEAGSAELGAWEPIPQDAARIGRVTVRATAAGALQFRATLHGKIPGSSEEHDFNEDELTLDVRANHRSPAAQTLKNTLGSVQIARAGSTVPLPVWELGQENTVELLCGRQGDVRQAVADAGLDPGKVTVEWVAGPAFAQQGAPALYPSSGRLSACRFRAAGASPAPALQISATVYYGGEFVCGTSAGFTVARSGTVPLTADNFPDRYFRAWLGKHWDKNGDGAIDLAAEALPTLNVDTQGIYDLTGIALFPDLTGLVCSSNLLTALDVSGNPSLTRLVCDENQLTGLDVTRNPYLEQLDCSYNALSALDLGGNPALKTLDVSENALSVLDLDRNPALETLDCVHNALTTLRVGGCGRLRSLYCAQNHLTALELGGTPLLQAEDTDLNTTRYGCQTVQASAVRSGDFYVADIGALVGAGGLGRVSAPHMPGRSDVPYRMQDGKVYIPWEEQPEFEYQYQTGCAAAPAMTVKVTCDTSAPGIPADDSQVRAFVTRLYEVCLGRTPDDAGLDGWTDALVSHRNTGSEAAYGFIFSDEFKAKNYCNSCYIDHLYSAFMGREPDAEGHAAWIRVLEEEGESREHVFNGFVGSKEFKAICQQYGIDPGTGTAEPEGVGTVRRGTCAGCGATDGVEDFVVRLYRVCLDRDPDENAQAWMENLRMHKDTGRTAAEGFIFSDEFKARGFDNETFVQYLYRAFFDRVPKDGEEGIWLTKLNNGGSREDVVPGFTGSDEFAVLCRRYGILAQ